jgi:maltooligosyltrehalose trehalohydrolase
MTSPIPVEVWAPAATTVEVELPGEGRTVPLEPLGPGWWGGVALPAGSDYAFRVDGGPPRPDPRSAWQPTGVHGPSRVFDPVPGRPPAWPGIDARGAVTYELHIGTFTPQGTLDAAATRLQHLADLGIQVVELMPVAAFSGRNGWGYDGVDLYAVHDAYGGPAALQRFVVAAHEHGLGVCLDVVYNHLGPSGNYLADFGPYFTDRHHTPWGAAVNLDGPDAGPVRRFLVENALRWFEDFGIDALRLDAIHALADDSPRHLLAELSDDVAALERRVGRPITLIAESDLNDVRVVEPTAEGGLGMDAQWADDVHHAIHSLMTEERQGYYVDFGTLPVLEVALTDVFVHQGTHSTYRKKPWGAPVPPGVDGHAFVVFASNHDQVGNRGLGDRPSAVLTDGQLAIELALVLLSHYTPMLFMGEEWAARTPWRFFTDHPEPDLAEAVRVGRQEEFGEFGWEDTYGHDALVPDPQAKDTFVASRLDWQEPARPANARFLTFTRDLITLRRDTADLASGDRSRTTVRFDADGRWLVMERGAHAVVVCLSDAGCDLELTGASDRPVLLAWEPVVATADRVRMSGHGVAVLGPATAGAGR